jgi:nitrogen fixation protein
MKRLTVDIRNMKESMIVREPAVCVAKDQLWYGLNIALRDVWRWRGRELEVPGSFALYPRRATEEDLRRWGVPLGLREWNVFGYND